MSAVAVKHQSSDSRTISDGSNRGKGRPKGATGARDRGGNEGWKRLTTGRAGGELDEAGDGQDQRLGRQDVGGRTKKAATAAATRDPGSSWFPERKKPNAAILLDVFLRDDDDGAHGNDEGAAVSARSDEFKSN